MREVPAPRPAAPAVQAQPAQRVRARGGQARAAADAKKSKKDQRRRRERAFASPIPIASIGRTSASPRRSWPTYYVSVWDWIKPHILGRALSLVRAPEGVGGETFFQKHIAANVKSSPLRRAVAGKDHDVIAVETLDDLVALVQSGALEIHVRGSRLDSLETCDRIVFDLDPGEGVAWQQIVAAAREVRERLKAEKLESFVKLSGGKGIHVVVPDRRRRLGHRQAVLRPSIAVRMAADSPKLYLAKMTKSLRSGPHLHRLFPQLARGDLDRALLDARAARRAGVGAAHLGAAVAHQRRQRFLRARSEKAHQG